MMLVAVAGCLNKVDQTKVIAKVGKTIYSVDDINSKIDKLDPQRKAFFEKKENKVRFLDQLIDQEIIFQLAKKDGLHREKDYKELVKKLKRDVLIEYFIEQNVVNAAEVTRAEVETYYQENSQVFDAFEARNLSHILVEKRSDAKKVQSRINKGGKFDALAREFSIDPSKNNGGQLGWVRKSDLVPEFANAAFKLTKKRPVSKIVKTQYGYHIIQLNETRMQPKQSLESVYQRISNELLSQKRADKYKQLLDGGKETVKIERSIENL